MKNTIKFIAIAILLTANFLSINAQDVTETSIVVATVIEKVEKKVEAKTKRQSNSLDESWTGFYVGGFGRVTNSRASANTSTVFAQGGYNSQNNVNRINGIGAQKVTTNGFNGGGTVGYNYQTGKFLVGAEFDFSSNRINKSVSATTTYINSSLTATVNQSVKSDWMMTARPRIGVAMKKVLIYGTGGLAVTNVKYNETFTDTLTPPASQSGSFSKTKTGWTAGAGMEFKVSNRWSVKGEYLYSQFGHTSITSNNLRGSDFNISTISYPNQVFTHSTDLRSHSVRFGVNYRF